MMKLLIFNFLFLGPLAFSSTLNGTYKTKCLPFGVGGEKSMLSNVLIKESTLESSHKVYSDKSCQHLAAIFDYKGQINYSNEIEKGPLDHKIGRAFLVLFDPETIMNLNKSSDCQGIGFIAGKPIAANNLSKCFPLWVPTAGSFAFDMFERKGSTFSFGAFPLIWVTKEENRPALHNRLIYNKD